MGGIDGACMPCRDCRPLGALRLRWAFGCNVGGPSLFFGGPLHRWGVGWTKQNASIDHPISAIARALKRPDRRKVRDELPVSSQAKCPRSRVMFQYQATRAPGSPKTHLSYLYVRVDIYHIYWHVCILTGELRELCWSSGRKSVPCRPQDRSHLKIHPGLAVLGPRGK